jgi:TetR/AcrR family transcriptional repressor of bet genes
LLYNGGSSIPADTVTVTPPKKTQATRGRPRNQPEINDYRRRALMEGTIRSMAEHGVAATTIQTISKAAGVSRGLSGHYFESKEMLLAESFKYLFSSVSDQVKEYVNSSGAQTANQRLMAVPEALFSARIFTQRNRDAFLSFWHEVRFNTLMRKANQELYRGYIKNMTALFDEAAAETNAAIDTRRAAVGLIAISDGLWLGLTIHGPLLSAQEAVGFCQRYIEDQLETR